mmetsp:Transcript_34438/g.110619  ORF Transcript_34438/g.110619 Transcript_34438/m.110619 type:complete len:334 (-) Transcript_34438:1200-2201(-)
MQRGGCSGVARASLTGVHAMGSAEVSLAVEVAKGVLERLGRLQPLGRVEGERLVEKVGQHHNLARLGLAEFCALREEGAQIVPRDGALLELDEANDLAAGDAVALLVEEVVVGVVVQLCKDALADELVRHLALHLLDELEHRVVRVAHEHDAAGVELKQRHGGGPSVDRARKVQAHHDLGGAVKARDHVRGELLVVGLHRGAEVAHLEQVVLFVDDDVVRLEVGVHDAELLHVSQRGEQLARVGAHRVYLDAALVPKLLHSGAQVLVQRLEDHAEVVLVVKAADEADAVLAVLRVRVAQPLQDRNLLLARAAHHLVVSLHLDRHLGRLALCGA